ncbi:MAG: delta-60 repeat domain-containing protein [Acidobacteriota bacterium]|nr:delta-60 repeat domain-containing protein [Acidobacteriota bacterium]
MVEAVVVQPDGKVVLGGWFTRVNGVARSGIARLNADGTLDTSFGAGQSGVSGGRFPAVSAVAVQPDGKVVLGGKFTRVNGVARSGIARLNVDGTLDASFGAGQSGVSESVDAVVVQSDGKVVLGGRFTRVNGVARGGIARLNADGTLDASFGAGQSGVSESVDAVVVKPDVRLAALKKRLSGRLNVMALWQVCQR